MENPHPERAWFGLQFLGSRSSGATLRSSLVGRGSCFPYLPIYTTSTFDLCSHNNHHCMPLVSICPGLHALLLLAIPLSYVTYLVLSCGALIQGVANQPFSGNASIIQTSSGRPGTSPHRVSLSSSCQPSSCSCPLTAVFLESGAWNPGPGACVWGKLENPFRVYERPYNINVPVS